MKTQDGGPQGAHYLKGPIQTENQNMIRMASGVPATNDQALYHFLSNSPWDSDTVITQVAQRPNDAIGGQSGTDLLINETAIVRKGDKYVRHGLSNQNNNFWG